MNKGEKSSYIDFGSRLGSVLLPTRTSTLCRLFVSSRNGSPCGAQMANVSYVRRCMHSAQGGLVKICDALLTSLEGLYKPLQLKAPSQGPWTCVHPHDLWKKTWHSLTEDKKVPPNKVYIPSACKKVPTLKDKYYSERLWSWPVCEIEDWRAPHVEFVIFCCRSNQQWLRLVFFHRI